MQTTVDAANPMRVESDPGSAFEELTLAGERNIEGQVKLPGISLWT